MKPDVYLLTVFKRYETKRKAAKMGTEIVAACNRVLSFLRTLRQDRRAVTALEYGLIASLIAITIISSVNLEGTRLANVFTTIAAKL